jgi:DNA-binding response OmpR family regulator
VVEDDPAIAANLHDYLAARGHVVDNAGDGLTGLHLAVTQPFDAIVLDLALPGIDGMALCRKLRSEAHCATPVLMATARGTLEDKLAGFDSGADDYIVKPFALKELEARLNALHKRHSGRITPRALEVGELSLDPRTLSIRFAGHEVRLPPKCIRLLEFMMSEPGRVYSRSELETAVWGDTLEASDTLRTHMHILRRELIAAGGYSPVQNVHGMGYRLARKDDA